LADVARKSAPASAQSPATAGIGMPSTSAASDARVGAKSNVDMGRGAIALYHVHISLPVVLAAAIRGTGGTNGKGPSFDGEPLWESVPIT
jgi:hypothetical protein